MPNPPILNVVLLNDKVLISQVNIKMDEMSEKITEVILIQPFLINGESLSPYLSEYTNQTQFHIQPTKVFTFLEPKPEVKAKYEKLVK